MKVEPITQRAQSEVTMEGAERVRMRMLIGPGDGAARFHMRHFEVAPGGHTPLHRHDYEHEVLVLSGRGIVTGGEQQREIGPGDVVWIPPNELHQFRNAGDQPLEFICLIPAPECCA